VFYSFHFFLILNLFSKPKLFFPVVIYKKKAGFKGATTSIFKVLTWVAPFFPLFALLFGRDSTKDICATIWFGGELILSGPLASKNF